MACALGSGCALPVRAGREALADLRPEALLLVLAAAFLFVVFRGLGRASGVSPAALGLVCGLAVATKVTALPLVLAGLLALPRERRPRFLGTAALTLAVAVLPVLPQLRETVRFIVQSLSGPGVYGSGLLEGTYGPTLRALAPQLLLALAGVVGCLVVAKRTATDPRRAASARALIAFSLAQGASILLLLWQPQGGSRYLLPTFALFGANLVLALETRGWQGWAGTRTTAMALVALAGLELAGVRSLSSRLARSSAEQRGAAGAAEGLRDCGLVRYHKASAPEAALFLGQMRPSPALVVHMERRYPAAIFLGYSAEDGGWFHVPAGNMVKPRFMGFGGPLPTEAVPTQGGCLAFQGSTPGPGRIFQGTGFRRESIPVPGRLETRYTSPTEAVYVVTVDAPAAPR